MAAVKLLNFSINVEKHSLKHLALLTTIRHGHTIRGKPPGVARTLEQRLKGTRKMLGLPGLRLCFNNFHYQNLQK